MPRRTNDFQDRLVMTASIPLPDQASGFVRTRLLRGLPNTLMIIHSAAIERLYAGTIANTAQLSMRLELISAPKQVLPVELRKHRAVYKFHPRRG